MLGKLNDILNELSSINDFLSSGLKQK